MISIWSGKESGTEAPLCGTETPLVYPPVETGNQPYRYMDIYVYIF